MDERKEYSSALIKLPGLIPKSNTKQKKVDYHHHQAASPLALEVLRQQQQGNTIKQTAKAISNKLRVVGEYESSHDAVNLWVAVMQACHYAVDNRRKMTMVVSARVFWCIRLCIKEDGKCTMELSNKGLPCW